MEEWVEKAVKAGGKVLVGGKRDGVLFDATILEDVPFECEVVSEEIFGPILVISKYSEFKDAIKQANESRYGLQAGVFTNDLNKAFYAYEKLQVTAVATFSYFFVVLPAFPFSSVSPVVLVASTQVWERGLGLRRSGVKDVFKSI